MLSNRLFNSAAERVMCNLRHRLFSHLISQEIGFYDRIRTGELMNRLSEVLAYKRPIIAHAPCDVTVDCNDPRWL